MFELPEDTQQIRDLAREFARSEIMPGAPSRDKNKAFPQEILGQLSEMGFMGMFVPEAYGGTGLPILD